MTVPLGIGDAEGHVPQGDKRHQGLCPTGRGMPGTVGPHGGDTVLSPWGAVRAASPQWGVPRAGSLWDGPCPQGDLGH